MGEYSQSVTSHNSTYVHRRPCGAPRAMRRCGAPLRHMAPRPGWARGHVTYVRFVMRNCANPDSSKYYDTVMSIDDSSAIQIRLEDRAMHQMTTMLQNVQWVFFDLGNTLIDEDIAIFDRMRRIVAASFELGYKGVTADTLYDKLCVAAAGFSRRNTIEALETSGIGRLDSQNLVEAIRYCPSGEKLFATTKAVLQKCYGHYRIGYIANQQPGLEQRLSGWDIQRYFSVGVDSGSCSFYKPQPEIFEEAMRRAKCLPEEAVMVGDRIDTDIAPAKLLGLRTIRIVQGYSRLQMPRRPEEDADVSLQGLDQFLAFLQ